jgi:endogenous inhibitor of DNA gyrase (YacG/DUF329 family)
MESRKQIPPFCSDRCKLIDLGAWASEEHKIPVAPDAEDELFSGDFDPRLMPLRPHEAVVLLVVEVFRQELQLVGQVFALRTLALLHHGAEQGAQAQAWIKSDFLRRIQTLRNSCRAHS